jgi:hypothetical protein
MRLLKHGYGLYLTGANFIGDLTPAQLDDNIRI